MTIRPEQGDFHHICMHIHCVPGLAIEIAGSFKSEFFGAYNTGLCHHAMRSIIFVLSATASPIRKVTKPKKKMEEEELNAQHTQLEKITCDAKPPIKLSTKTSIFLREKIKKEATTKHVSYSNKNNGQKPVSVGNNMHHFYLTFCFVFELKI